MNQHSPLPWHVGTSPDGRMAVKFEGKRGTGWVAWVEREDEYNKLLPVEANADLIVSAVNSYEDLLEACRNLVEKWDAFQDRGVGLKRRDFDAARKAIAKAESLKT